jgi:uncharacterized OsmC-like protein
MSQTLAASKSEKLPLNGVDTPNLLATLNVVKGQPELAKFQFRSTTRWMAGTHSQSTIESFRGAGSEHVHRKVFTFDSDHPAVLVGADQGPTPVEHLLHALGGCIIAGLGNIAAVRGVTLTEVEANIEGDIDLLGIFGMSDTVRNGYQAIRATFRVKGDAPEEKLRELVEQARARSAVFDVLSNGVPVEINVTT